MDAEGDEAVAFAAIEKVGLTSVAISPVCPHPDPSPDPLAGTPQCKMLESQLLQSVAELKKRNRIFGKEPSIEDLVNPIEEKEIGQSEFIFEGGDVEICSQVRREAAIARGEIIEIDSDDEDDEPQRPEMQISDMIRICHELEGVVLDSSAGCSLELSRNLRRFRAEMTRKEFRNMKQAGLQDFWKDKDL
jgi:hypothetical protein